MAHARGLTRRGTEPSRRRRSWAVGPGGTVVTAITASGSGFIGFGVSMVLEGLTIVRIRGEVLVTLDSVSGAGSSLVGAFGIGLATAEAFAAGIASVPTPVSDDDWNGWMWH